MAPPPRLWSLKWPRPPTLLRPIRKWESSWFSNTLAADGGSLISDWTIAQVNQSGLGGSTHGHQGAPQLDGSQAKWLDDADVSAGWVINV